jgi:hypothetical protein
MYKYSTLSIGERQLLAIGIAKHEHIKIKNILIQGKSTKIIVKPINTLVVHCKHFKNGN